MENIRIYAKDILGKDTQDPVFHMRESYKIAEGNGWVARLSTCGELTASYTDKATGEEIINEEIFERRLTTDELISKAEEDGSLKMINNPWYEIEFFKYLPEQTPEYLDLLSDDCVCFSFDEAMETLSIYLNDEHFKRELAERLGE